MAKKYWLMKSEPEVFSITDLEKNGKTLWEGVRNYQARNYMMNDMTVGDEVLFYHSSTQPPGVAGLATVSMAAIPDPTAFDKKSEYFEPKATKEKPMWLCVEVKFEKKFKALLALDQIRANKKLSKMALLQKGSRLSVQPVTALEFKEILRMVAE